MPGIKDVAKKAEVSVATVSRVINHNPNVKPYLKERVLQAIEELNYQPSGIARNMRNQSSPVIGLIIPDIQNPFFTSLVRAVEDVALENDYTVLLCNSDEKPDKEQLYIDVLARERISGIIIIPSHKNCCDRLKDINIPVVVVDRILSGLATDLVVVDNVYGSREATSHLIELGHKRIGLVSAPTGVSIGVDRRRGYELAMQDHGLQINESLIQLGDFKEAGGYQATVKLLEFDPRPTAIFAVNNLMAMGALRAIQEYDLKIPDDISFIAFDDMSWFAFFNPPLTAVRQPVYEIGAKAANLLFDRLDNVADKDVFKIVLQPELIVRESTSKISEEQF